MTDKQYNKMVESSQLSMDEFMGKYHGHYPDELKYSTKVSVNITVDDKIYAYSGVKLKLGGNSSKFYPKVGFNLKLNKQDKFFGRKNLHLRPDYNDVSRLHSKIAIDLVNKWNIPTVQESFANIYINGKYFGFYMLLNTINAAWINDIYKLPEEEEVKTLYSCEGLKLAFNPTIVRNICHNKKEEYLNYTQPLYDMIDEVYEYTSLTQLQQKFDNVDDMRKMFIYEYLFGTPDNFIMAGNNYNFYKKSNGKWDFIPMDFSILYLYDFEGMLSAIDYPVPRQKKLIDYAKRALEVTIYDLKQQVEELKNKLQELSKKNREKYQKKIDKLLKKIKNYKKDLSNIKF
ncbi:hypothetical protein PIROE2DRAFT_57079 [Piromyces sp. E2]|nr:hypothetical protein PIROE2DRAFT_57079 [Piromyces sp. E2]|eukprot:OUM70017.1 hypothetical protein PIROE2DRAFT_57079 [Piromyces sp. E2]